eukprot:2408958-Amphidinium_carterae.2
MTGLCHLRHPADVVPCSGLPVSQVVSTCCRRWFPTCAEFCHTCKSETLGQKAAAEMQANHPCRDLPPRNGGQQITSLPQLAWTDAAYCSGAWVEMHRQRNQSSPQCINAAVHAIENAGFVAYPLCSAMITAANIVWFDAGSSTVPADGQEQQGCLGDELVEESTDKGKRYSQGGRKCNELNDELNLSPRAKGDGEKQLCGSCT